MLNKTTASKPVLIIVFNHRYDQNIVLLEKIYGDRFSNIFHLVPFYDGDKPNVIPVYASSFYFQGYFAQGLKHYFSEQFKHYLFVADDLLLNPKINEHNYKEYFNLDTDDSYIPEIFQLHKLTNENTLRFEAMANTPVHTAKLFWWRIKLAVRYQHLKAGLEINKEMPSNEEAAVIFKNQGYPVEPLSYQDVNGALFPFRLKTHEQRLHVAKYLFNTKTLTKSYRLSYPLVGSYSDIVIVSKNAIKKFCHYCGVFAANELFVEFAIPSALLLSATKVVTEPMIGKRGEVYWSYTKKESVAYETVMQRYHYNLNELLENFPESTLYIHPIKLSKWNTQTT